MLALGREVTGMMGQKTVLEQDTLCAWSGSSFAVVRGIGVWIREAGSSQAQNN